MVFDGLEIDGEFDKMIEICQGLAEKHIIPMSHRNIPIHTEKGEKYLGRDES